MSAMRVYGIAENDWATSHAPVVNTQATCTRAAAGVGKRNVCTALTVMLCAGATAPTAVQVTVRLIDGGAGGSTYLWQAHLSLPAVAGASTGIVLVPVWFKGSPNTAMTLEFSAAAGANTFESVSMEGDTL